MKKSLRASIIFSLFALLLISSKVAAQVPSVTASNPKGDVALERLEREIARLSKNSGGVVGATAIHIETARRVSLNGGERFPMASTFKVPIAVQLLTRVDKGEVKLLGPRGRLGLLFPGYPKKVRQGESFPYVNEEHVGECLFRYGCRRERDEQEKPKADDR